MKRLLCMLIIAASAATPIVFGGCSVKPWEVEWKALTFVVDGKGKDVGFDAIDHFGSVMAGVITLEFFGDGSVEFCDYTGKGHSGTFTAKNTNRDTEVKFGFDDGVTGYGNCGKFGFDGVWCEAHFVIDGVEYNFCNSEYNAGPSRDTLDECLARTANELTTGKTVYRPFGYSEYLKGNIFCEQGRYFAVCGGKGFALDGFGEYFCYYYTAENIVKGELLEGDCILRTDGSRAAIYYPMPK